MSRRRARPVRPGQQPGCEIGLRQRAAHRPVALSADRRADADVSRPARHIAAREELLRAVERARRQQIDLTGKRRVGEEARGEPRRRTDRTAQDIDRRKGMRFLIVLDDDRQAGVFEDAAARMPNPPGRFAGIVHVVGRIPRCAGSRGIVRLYVGIDGADQTDAGSEDLRVGLSQRDRRGDARAGADVNRQTA